MRLFIIFFLLLFLSLSANAEIPIIQLKVSDYNILAEVAYKKKYRIQGLMHRDTLDRDSGMLFVFPEINHHSMWMVNTYIPLSIAFLDQEGIIINIFDMMPLTKTKYSATSKAKYALEMNLGWFSSRNIQPGKKIIGLENAPKAE